jgi:hypothetical protein
MSKTLSNEQLGILVNARESFRNDAVLRENFIISMLVDYPEQCTTMLQELMKGRETPQPNSIPAGHVRIETREGQYAYVHTDDLANVRSYSYAGKKVDAIKALRGFTRWGLKEAKDYVEDHYC